MIAIGILVGAIEGIGLVLTVIEAGPIALIESVRFFVCGGLVYK